MTPIAIDLDTLESFPNHGTVSLSTQPRSSKVEIHLASVEVLSDHTEYYLGNKSDPISIRPFLFGPPPSTPSGRVFPKDFTVSMTPDGNYIPVFNQDNAQRRFTIMGATKYNVTAILHETLDSSDHIIFL